MSKKNVVAIGLDAVGPEPLRHWLDSGLLPNLANLRDQGAFGTLANPTWYRTENSWLNFLHGCDASVSQEWGHQEYVAGEYEASERPGYSFHRLQPFYMNEGVKAMVFDVPLVGATPGMNGIQVFGWGTEANQILRESQPPELMRELVQGHGPHPVYRPHLPEGEAPESNICYRIPSIYDAAGLRDLKDKLVSATRQRTDMILDMMQRETWPLCLAVYGESHTAGHLFWHSGQNHPLQHEREGEEDYYLQVLQAIDIGVGRIREQVSDEADFYVFSPHGMQGNTLDLTTMLFLPEMLYRYSFGEAAMAEGVYGSELPAPATHYRRHWREEIWDLRTTAGERELESPYSQEKQGDPLDWQPGNWYRKCWPHMKAFALSGYSEGLIRINVQGRDGPTGIPEEDFMRVCNELRDLFMGLRDARTGELVASEVRQIRTSPDDTSADKPPADLMVIWKESGATDVVEHPVYGRVGPAPFFRSGGHSTEGFLMACGDGYVSGTELSDVHVTELTATLLSRLGLPVPGHVHGKPLRTS